MEKTPKSKFFGFKSKRGREPPRFDNTTENSVVSKKDVKDLETSVMVEDVLQTPKVKTELFLMDDELAYTTSQSPQFKVGWNDGSDNSTVEMDSPVYIAPVQRRIRRCPDNLLNRVIKSNASNVPERSSFENDCDILQCVSWAKNLLEFTNTDCEGDTQSSRTDSVKNVIGNCAGVDILDDSADELMVLCSQAVEESIPQKHNITPIRNQSKRFKIDESSTSKLPNFKCNLEKKPMDQSVKKNQIVASNQQTLLECRSNNCHSLKKNIFGSKSNNNNNGTSNFNYHNVPVNNSRNNLNCPLSTVSSSKLPVPSKTLTNSDSLESLLDENEFNSVDFSFMDNLQIDKSSVTTSKPVTPCGPPKLVRYTKEQIEKRRLEAKKKLLFKKRFRSM